MRKRGSAWALPLLNDQIDSTFRSFAMLSLFGTTLPDSQREIRAWSTPMASASYP